MTRFGLAVAGSTALTPILVLAAMPLLDPHWAIRPQIGFGYVALLAGIALATLAVSALPLAIAILSSRIGRTDLLASGNAAFGLVLATPLLVRGGHVSPTPVILGAEIAIASLIVSIIFFATKERTYNG